jgi:predicted ATPase
MASAPHKQFFLSAVTDEFGSYRSLLAKDLNRPNLSSKVQEDFITTSDCTLMKLDEYLRHCDVVIHLIGKSTGSIPPKESVVRLLAAYPDLPRKVPAIADLLSRAQPDISYTQWEAYLGLYHGCHVYIYRPGSTAQPDHKFKFDADEEKSQQEHYFRICSAVGRDRGEFADQERLSSRVLIDLVSILPRLESISVPKWSIPCADNDFYGRDSDTEKIRFLLSIQKHGLITITGPGGIGKTRLACEAVAGLHASYPGGGYFIELKELETVVEISSAVADALGLRLDVHGDPVTILSNMLQTRQPTLLILDNFEHITNLAMHTVKIWRGAAPQVQIVATSRHPLGLTGEAVHHLMPLSLPTFEDIDNLNPHWTYESPAVRLFMATASAQGEIVLPDEQNALLLTNLTRKLDGHPLAIILVARRIGFFSLQELHNEVEANRVQAAESFGKALSDTIRWSYRLLDESTREAFLRLCVFREGLDKEAANHMLSDLSSRIKRSTSQILQELCAWSFIVAVRRGSTTRYQIYQTIQDFGRLEWPESHQEPREWASLWLNYYLKVVERLSPLLVSAKGAIPLATLVEERENILAAHAWGLANGMINESARLILGFALVLQLRGPWQIQTELYECTLAKICLDNVTLRCRILLILSEARWCEGDYQKALVYAQEAVKLSKSLNDEKMLAESLLEEGERLEDIGERQQALRIYQAGRECAERSGSALLVALHSAGIAYLLDRSGDYILALETIRYARRSLEYSDDINALSRLVNREGLILWHSGQPEAAIHEFRIAEALFDQADNPRWRAGVMTNIGLAEVDTDNLSESVIQFQNAAKLHLRQGNRSWWAVNQAGYGSAMIMLGQHEEALKILIDALVVAESTGFKENIAMTLGLLGRVYVKMQKWLLAEDFLTRALKIEEEITQQERRYVGNLIQRCLIRRQLGQFDLAISDFRTAQELRVKLCLDLLKNIKLVCEDLALADQLQKDFL